MQPSFSFRGLEIHTRRMWQQALVEQAEDFMVQNGLNALIFHQNDLIDRLVFPKKYMDDPFMWRRRCGIRMHEVYNNRHYINKIAREAKERGIDFYLEVKEIEFPDEILELFPHLLRPNAAVCPTDPFWWEYLCEKVKELVEVVPDLKGLVVSLGTRESKVTMARNECDCERCRHYALYDWYKNAIEALYKPLAAAGKQLLIRDFSYSADNQGILLDAASAVSADIIVTLKNTPHDYYPTFPPNPKIGHTGAHTAYVEFDTWGQFFGMGFFPVSLVDFMRERMAYCAEQGVKGVWFRTDWECMYEYSTLNTNNMLNLFAGAMLAQNVAATADDIYAAWYRYGVTPPMWTGSFLKPPVPVRDPAAQQCLRAFMEESWEVMRRTIYVRDHWFFEDEQNPDTIEKAYDMMVHIHGRDDWEPGASARVAATDENIAAVLAEKAEALRRVEGLPSLLRPDALGLPPALAGELREMLDLYRWYVQLADHAARVVFRTRQVMDGGGDRAAALAAVEGLRAFREQVAGRLQGTHYPHLVYWLLCTERMRLLIEDAVRHLA